MPFLQAGIAALATLCAVVLGGWLTLRGQERLWRRDNDRQWRDIRLKTYVEFTTAFREYIAFVLVPTTALTAVPRQSAPGDLMPFFDETGSSYKQRLEASRTAVRLVASSPATIEASNAMMANARLIAASRAQHAADEIPAQLFEDLWTAERGFTLAARAEMGLNTTFDLRARLAAEPQDAL
jgi:hypothetical protein